jgi:alcohol dehydrogenase (cytochrome c)
MRKAWLLEHFQEKWNPVFRPKMRQCKNARAVSAPGLCEAALATVLALSPTLALGQTTEELNNDGKKTENVLTQSMGLDRKSYSPLAQINKSNVKRLVPVWATSLMNDLGELAAPVVHDGVIYAINAKWTFAIDVETGRQIWRTPVQTEPGMTRAGSATYRGAPAIYDGKLFRVTVDNHLVALEMKTGRVLWNRKFAEWKEGYHSSGAPIVANGVLISGVAGGESTTRGFLDGWNPDTGEKLWRRYTIPAPGEPGSETWPANSDAWKYGGGSIWRSGSYDPQLDLVYWGVGNAEPYDPRPREARDSLFTSSVLAIRPKTGEIACYYQYTPNDVYDVDATDEQVLADLPVEGQTRKVMIQSNKNGFMYVLDRTNCKLIAAHPYTKVNWASGIDLATGRPQLTGVYKDFLAGGEVEILPSRGSNAVPIAFDPTKGLVYAAPWDEPRIQQLAPPKPQVIGENSTGVNARQPRIEPGQVVGYYIAMDPLTGQRKWEVPLTDIPSSAGMLATGGGLVFTGKPTGEFLALDEDTGRILWQFKTSSSVNSTAITYTHNGRQYVTVASGLGGILANRAIGGRVPTGGSLWTFSLMPE